MRLKKPDLTLWYPSTSTSNEVLCGWKFGAKPEILYALDRELCMTGTTLSLKDQKALVTGANSGIGEAVARALAAAGAAVIVNYVANPDAARKVVSDIKAAGGQALPIQADESNEKQLQA